MPLYRFCELTAYSLLCFLPYLFLFLYVFKGKLRFHPVINVLGIILLIVLRCCYGLYNYFDENRIAEPNPGILVYVAFCLIFVKEKFGKGLFTMLMLTNISTFTMVVAKTAEGLLFPTLALEIHRWSNIITLVIVEAITLIPLFFYIKNVYLKATEQVMPKNVWRYLWFIPLTLYFVTYRTLYHGAEGFKELTLRVQHSIYLLLITAGGMLIYTMVVNLINEHSENMRLKEKERLQSLQREQYDSLQDRIEEARRAKHDMRQHLHVISAYASDKKYDELESYLAKYIKTLPEDNKLVYCEHYAVNALIQYFAGYAKMIGAGFSANVKLDNDLSIPDETLTVLLGNLLENAMEACTREKMAGVVSVRAKRDESAVFFKVVNSCSIEPKKDKSGKYLSSKRKRGYGIGIESVQNITAQYGGLMKINYEEGVFTVSVMLNLP